MLAQPWRIKNYMPHVSDRKSTITATLKRNVDPTTDLTKEMPRCETLTKPFTQFSIDNIVKERNNRFQARKPLYQENSSTHVDPDLEASTCNQIELQSEIVPIQCTNEIVTNNTPDYNNRNQNHKTRNDDVPNEFGNDFEKTAVLGNLTHNKLKEIKAEEQSCVQKMSSIGVISDALEDRIQNQLKNKRTDAKAYEFGDKSSEVKHALTPVNNVSNCRENAQLSLPSPSYPTSASIGSEPSSILSSLLCAHDVSQFTPQSNIITKKTDILIHSKDKSVRRFSVTKNGCNLKTEAVSSKKKIGIPNRKSHENTFTVLNIPNISCCQNNVAPPSPPKRQRLSKIDLAMIRRKEHNDKSRHKNVQRQQREECKNKRDKHLDKWSMYYSGDSESEGEEQRVDLWICSGPPSKMSNNPQKLGFLKLFGLTTHHVKNCK